MERRRQEWAGTRPWTSENYRPPASLGVQWLRICLAVQRTLVPSLVREEPTCLGAAKPVCHNNWASSLESWSCDCWAQELQSLKPTRPRACALQQEKPAAWGSCALRRTVPTRRNQRKPNGLILYCASPEHPAVLSTLIIFLMDSMTGQTVTPHAAVKTYRSQNK